MARPAVSSTTPTTVTGSLSVSIDYDDTTASHAVDAPDCQTTDVGGDENTGDNGGSTVTPTPQEQPSTTPEEQPVEVGGDEVVNEESPTTEAPTTDVESEQVVNDTEGGQPVVTTATPQPRRETAVLGAEVTRSSLPRTGTSSTIVLAITGVLLLAAGFGLQRIGKLASVRS